MEHQCFRFNAAIPPLKNTLQGGMVSSSGGGSDLGYTIIKQRLKRRLSGKFTVSTAKQIPIMHS